MSTRQEADWQERSSSSVSVQCFVSGRFFGEVHVGVAVLKIRPE